MPADVIVNSVFFRLRHPVHEKGMVNAFDATTQEWIKDADGVATPLKEKGPFTPQQLEAKGLTLPVILSAALQTAMCDRTDALAQIAVAEKQRGEARASESAVKVERDKALALVAELQTKLAQSVAAGAEAQSELRRVSTLANNLSRLVPLGR